MQWLRGFRETEARRRTSARPPVTHVVILDGTMSALSGENQTHAGTTYKLLRELPASALVSLYYEAGIQWPNWRSTHQVATGRGINRQIRRAYGYLASRYHPGDRIILMGYSRGAYAARSLAGVIDKIGLLQTHHATVRNVRQAYRHYQNAPGSDTARIFSQAYCHPRTEIEMVGVWDTVKALGLRLPLLWQRSEAQHAFHNHALSDVVRHGFHALALDETREAFAPVLWSCPPNWNGRVEQVWFRGCHGDVGGHIGSYEPARALANISLVWMLDKLEFCGVPLPEGWIARFPCDPEGPSVGSYRGWGKVFVIRKPRIVGRDASESLHPTAQPKNRTRDLPLYDPEMLHGV